MRVRARARRRARGLRLRARRPTRLPPERCERVLLGLAAFSAPYSCSHSSATWTVGSTYANLHGLFGPSTDRSSQMDLMTQDARPSGASIRQRVVGGSNGQPAAPGGPFLA